MGLKKAKQSEDKDGYSQRRTADQIYLSFMIGYVRRVNEATFGVTIGGVRIGAAKYSRLAQINLKSRIITFSRYAIENVPERGRRYLVIHELAHVKEPSHNKHFWELVARFEPDYRKVERELEECFKRNVLEDKLIAKPLSILRPKAEVSPDAIAYEPDSIWEVSNDLEDIDIFSDTRESTLCQGADFQQLHINLLQNENNPILDLD